MRWRTLPRGRRLAGAQQRGDDADDIVAGDGIDRSIGERRRVREAAAPIRLVAAPRLPPVRAQRNARIERLGECRHRRGPPALGDGVDAAMALAHVVEGDAVRFGQADHGPGPQAEVAPLAVNGQALNPGAGISDDVEVQSVAPVGMTPALHRLQGGCLECHVRFLWPVFCTISGGR